MDAKASRSMVGHQAATAISSAAGRSTSSVNDDILRGPGSLSPPASIAKWACDEPIPCYS